MSLSSWIIQLRGSMIFVLLKELETGYKVPKSVADLLVLSSPSDSHSSRGALD